MHRYVKHNYMLQSDMCVYVRMCKLTWPRMYGGLQRVHNSAHMSTCYIADFSACDMRVTHVWH